MRKISSGLRKHIQNLKIDESFTKLELILPMHYQDEIVNWINCGFLGMRFDEDSYYKASVILNVKEPNVFKYVKIYPTCYWLMIDENSIKVWFSLLP